MKLNEIAKALLFLAVPPLCPSCKKELLTQGQFLCEKCYGNICFIKGPFCPLCGGENDGIFEICRYCLKEEARPWKFGISLMHFNGLGRELIHRFKYNGDAVLAKPLGSLLSQKFMQSKNIKADMIVPIPLHWTNYLVRGYNQSELIAEFVSRASKIPLVKALRRKKRTRHQAKLNREERRKNILKAFYVPIREICKKRSILLIDDVITTGSTLRAAANALLDAGAEQIYVLTLARG